MEEPDLVPRCRRRALRHRPPFAPALVSAPQYSPANSTVAVDGSDSVDEEESNVATPPTVPGAVLTYCML